MKLIAHHRSLALAERHLRALGPGWRIKSRHNARGEYSERGHTFVFVKSELIYRWLVTFTYELTGHSFDVIATAQDAGEAEEKAVQFISTQPKTKHIASQLARWDVSTAKDDNAPVANHQQTEFRSESKK